MPWKTELDRLVHQSSIDACRGEGADPERALRLVRDLVSLRPDRPESHFHLGAIEETLGDKATDLPVSEGPAARWRFLGRLEAASRRGDLERVRALMADPAYEESIPQPEGRTALRAVGRMLLREGEEETVFEQYRRHLAAVDDEGSRRDAEFLLEDALRRADREDEDSGADAVVAALARAAAFAEAAGLDARARAKVDRKLGRLHQLEGRWEDAKACYRRALERLPADDPYRSVLVGDFALATLGVRGTLDLIPTPNRAGAEEAERLLQSEGNQGEGRSYNAIYTLGMLAYERGDWATAATSFREADALMRENRAKARIVHARSRFFLGHCLLQSGAQGQDLEDAERWITREVGAVSLDPEVKQGVLDALAEKVPNARIPGRGGRRGRDDRPRDDRPRDGGPRDEGRRDEGRRDGRRESRPPREDAGPRGDGHREGGHRDGGRPADAPREERPAAAHSASHGGGPSGGSRPGTAAQWLDEARAALAEDPHRALEMVDRAFKSRPDFPTWFEAYRTRLVALVALGEKGEALQTFERFRAKLYQRDALKELEAFLLDPAGPIRQVLDEPSFHEELVDLYEVMPGRGERFVEECVTSAQAHLASGDPRRVARAVALLCEACPRDPDTVRPLLEAANDAAARMGVEIQEPVLESCRCEGRAQPVRVLLVGGDEGRRPHRERLRELARRLGFQDEWVFTGAQPPYKTLRDIEEMARRATGILLHHATGPEVREEVKRLAQGIGVPVREAPWMGTEGVQREVLRLLQAVLAS